MPHTFTANDSAGDYVVLEPDTYNATLLRYEEYNEGEFGPALKFCFAIDYEDADGAEKTTDLSGLASLPSNGNSLGPKSKLRQWVEAIMGRKLADGEALDIDVCLDKPCRVVLDVVEKPKKDGQMGRWNKIIKVLPPRRKSTAPSAKTDGDLF